jgi:hypothetical protein
MRALRNIPRQSELCGNKFELPELLQLSWLICCVMASAIYKRWIAGCSVPSNPTIAKIANPRATSIALLRFS